MITFSVYFVLFWINQINYKSTQYIFYFTFFHFICFLSLPNSWIKSLKILMSGKPSITMRTNSSLKHLLPIRKIKYSLPSQLQEPSNSRHEKPSIIGTNLKILFESRAMMKVLKIFTIKNKLKSWQKTTNKDGFNFKMNLKIRSSNKLWNKASKERKAL